MCGAAVQPLEVMFLKRTLFTARILSVQAPCDTPERCVRIPSRIMLETQLTQVLASGKKTLVSGPQLPLPVPWEWMIENPAVGDASSTT